MYLSLRVDGLLNEGHIDDQQRTPRDNHVISG
jgi:hypothetical protein